MAGTATNTGSKNSKGRTIWKGPRGGRYVMQDGRKLYVRPKAVSAKAPAATPTSLKGPRGQTVYRGPRGGLFYRSNGRKVSFKAPGGAAVTLRPRSRAQALAAGRRGAAANLGGSEAARQAYIVGQAGYRRAPKLPELRPLQFEY